MSMPAAPIFSAFNIAQRADVDRMVKSLALTLWLMALRSALPPVDRRRFEARILTWRS